MAVAIFSELATELKRKRQSKKLSREKVAKQLHIPLATLVDIENPSQSEIPDSYLIGLYRRYGRLLEYDSQRLEELLANTNIRSPKKQPSKKKRISETWFIFNTLQKATAVSVMAIIGIYAAWQFGLLFAPPQLIIYELSERSVVSEQLLSVAGRSEPNSAVYINGDPITLNSDGSFNVDVYLQEGFNGLEFSASNNFSRVSIEQRIIFFEPDENMPASIDEQG